MREAFIAGSGFRLVEPAVAPYLGSGSDGESVAILMPDLSDELVAWEQPVPSPTIGPATLDRIVDAVARLHAQPWADYRPTSRDWGWPWCPLRDRLLLRSRPAAERCRADGLPIGDELIAGWDAFERIASPTARSLVAELTSDPAPLINALGGLPATGLHGDLDLTNVGLLDDGRVAFIDWQLMTLGPVAVDLGWMIVANSAVLPIGPDEVLARYRIAAVRAAREPLRMGARWPDGGAPEGPPIILPPRGLERTVGDWEGQRDLSWIVGLLLGGGRKAIDAESDIVLGSGVAARDDLATWCARAVEVAERRL